MKHITTTMSPLVAILAIACLVGTARPATAPDMYVRTATLTEARPDSMAEVEAVFDRRWTHGGTFAEWRRLALRDGFLCRGSSDCSWLDDRLDCWPGLPDGWDGRTEDSGWFGGHADDVRGECGCERGWWWDGARLECWEGDIGDKLPVWAWILMTVAATLVFAGVVIVVSKYMAEGCS